MRVAVENIVSLRVIPLEFQATSFHRQKLVFGVPFRVNHIITGLFLLTL